MVSEVVMLDGSVDALASKTSVLTHVVVLQNPFALAKKVSLPEMLMLLNEFVAEVAIGVPEQALEYNSQFANVPREPPFTVKLTSPATHKESLEASSEVGSLEKLPLQYLQRHN